MFILHDSGFNLFLCSVQVNVGYRGLTYRVSNRYICHVPKRRAGLI